MFERTVKLLIDRHDVLESGATQLLEKETLNELENCMLCAMR